MAAKLEDNGSLWVWLFLFRNFLGQMEENVRKLGRKLNNEWFCYFSCGYLFVLRLSPVWLTKFMEVGFGYLYFCAWCWCGKMIWQRKSWGFLGRNWWVGSCEENLQKKENNLYWVGSFFRFQFSCFLAMIIWESINHFRI